MRLVSFRSYLLSEKMDPQVGHVLIESGILMVQTGAPRGNLTRKFVDRDSQHLEEGEHFVVCPLCSRKLLEIGPRHLNPHGETVDSLLASFPQCRLRSGLAESRRVRTDAQKRHQSETLKRRFQTAEGVCTRLSIAESSRKRMEDPCRREAAAKTLALSTGTPEGREAISRRMLEAWRGEEYRARAMRYVEGNILELRESAARARAHLSKTSKAHRRFKEALPSWCQEILTTELQVGYYRIDEGSLRLKIAIEYDGCYWHGCHECGFAGVPGILHTDARKDSYLHNNGWLVVRVRDCEFRKNPEGVLSVVEDTLRRRAGDRAGQDPDQKSD